MITKFQVIMSSDEYQALERAAANEYRSVNDHIRFVLHRHMEQRGLLPTDVEAQPIKSAQPATEVQHECA